MEKQYTGIQITSGAALCWAKEAGHRVLRTNEHGMLVEMSLSANLYRELSKQKDISYHMYSPFYCFSIPKKLSDTPNNTHTNTNEN